MGKTTRSKGFSKIIILAIVLFVPGFLYLLMEKLGTHEYVKLPIYGEKELTGEMRRVMGRERPDTAYHQLSPLILTDAFGNQVPFLSSDTSISVVHLFAAKDTVLSTILLDYMDKLGLKFRSKNSVKLYSISVDSADTSEDLKQIYDKYEDVSGKKWSIVKSSSQDILSYAKDQMLIDAMVDPTDSTKFIFSDQFILIDSQRRIRGFYSASQNSEMKRLEDEIKVQIVEEVRNNPMTVKKR